MTMYASHVPIINGAMRADLETFKRGVMFAILSARVQFPRVQDQCTELAKRGPEANCLWGWKFDAYCYLQEHGKLVWQAATIGAGNARDCMENLCVIPGLGIVKAAFV